MSFKKTAKMLLKHQHMIALCRNVIIIGVICTALLSLNGNF